MIASQLAEAGAVIKTLRPIDDGQLVILVDGKTVKMGNRNLHVEVFKSSKPSELQDYANKAYVKKSVTDNTYLYEAMFAGIELLKTMPANEPRCLWVFSDGEDLNSAFRGDVVSQAAQGIENLCVFAIDSTPGPAVDPFFAKFAEQTKGQARKVGKGADLLAAFQKMGSRTIQQYAVSYEFPPPRVASAPPAPPPPTEKTILFNAVLFDFNKADLKPAGKEAIKAYREEARSKLARADKVIITGHTDNKGTAAYNKKLSLRRAQSVRDYLVSLGVDPKKLEVRGEGLTKPVADNSTEEGRAQNRRVEIEVTGLGS
jgi:outer membrane protein OmpA-like peptidoglycan-associated protein